MAENPFQPVIQPNSRQSGLWDLRMMSAANRAETPFERGMGRAGGRGGGGGNPMLAGLFGGGGEPDLSAYTYDPALRQQAIAAGVTPLEASQVRQNTLLPNSGFFGRHPGLSRAIEGAIYGAAAVPSSGGPESVGEGISNAFEGMIGGVQARQRAYQKQFAQPFEAQNMLENLKDRAEQRELRHTQMEYDHAKMIELQNAPPPRYEMPINRDVSAFQVWDSKQHKYVEEKNPYYDPKAASQKNASWAGTEHLREYLEPMGVKNPDDATPEQWDKARKQEQADRAKQRTEDRKPPQSLGFNPKTNRYETIGPGTSGGTIPLSALESGARLAQSHRDKWIQGAMDDPSKSHRLLRNDPNYQNIIKSPEMTKQALEKFYDNNDLGGSATDFVYTPDTGIVPTKP